MVRISPLRRSRRLSVCGFLGIRRGGTCDTVDDINPALPIRTMDYGNYGSLLWVMQDFDHQP